mgnify:CR=1 FL=1
MFKVTTLDMLKVPLDNKGNVNYSSGQVVITDISPTALPNNVTDFRVTASVQEVAHNIKAERNLNTLIDLTIYIFHEIQTQD